MDADYFFESPIMTDVEKMKNIMNFKLENVHEKNVKERKQMESEKGK